jgi:hypothetical protein
MNNGCICWLSLIFLLGILIFKGLTARRLYKSFGFKGLMKNEFCDVVQKSRACPNYLSVPWNFLEIPSKTVKPLSQDNRLT